MSIPFLPGGEHLHYNTYTYLLDDFTVTFYYPFALQVSINGVIQFYTIERIKTIWLKLEPSDTKEKAVLIVRLNSGTSLKYATVNTSENRQQLRLLIRETKEVIDVINWQSR